MENITFLRDISLLIGIWVAIYGIDSWRREHKGKREIGSEMGSSLRLTLAQN